MATIPMKWYNRIVSLNTVLKILVTLTNAIIEAFSSEMNLKITQEKEVKEDANDH